ncbi:MAG TPA: hybrid sensor histidine kinase/response regulator, partial [Chloroflexi bacterium]|nr:hybrid sensor histidine kinase/response regulator [Chloroflexota bacterium]
MIAASPTHLTRNRKQTVLIVDNDTALAEAIATTLDIDGLQTIVSHSGEEALALARAFHPDLILLDVMLPERSGIEVCATLKTDPSTSSIPVIFVTAKAEESDRLVGLAAGADEYITKPFSPTELLLVVNEILSGRSEQFSGFRRRGAKIADLAGVADDQLVVFAHEWKELFERERRERWALEEAHQRLGELDRLKAAFLSAVTHELMTPFASIGITLQVLKQGREQLLPDQQEALDNLSDEITNLHRLVNGVVKFAELVNKRREPQPQFVALRDIIPQALQPVLMMARSRGIEFEIVLPVDLPGVYADPDLLSEAIFQMAHNAVKFNVPGGHVWLEPTNPKGWVVIQVRDTG